MKSIPLFVLMLALAVAGCSKKDAAKKTCGTSEFDCLYQSVFTNPDYRNDTTVDLEVHSYSFKVAAQHSIVQIGYQSLSTFNTTPYVMEIYDSTTATLLYSGSHLFSPTATSYVSITPVLVVPGHSYTIRRLQTNWGADISNTIGRVAISLAQSYTPSPFPRTQGDLTVTGSAFYGTGGPINNEYLPYIDLILN